MARALWSGSVSFGLVNVPVRLMGGTVDKDIHFHQVDEKNGDRIRHKRVSERTGRYCSYQPEPAAALRWSVDA